jgi:peptidoglycan/LPS O-acetylase OafA/YrhL
MNFLQSSSNKIRFEISILQSIAIIAVLLLNFCDISGGFIGVDIFLVISGFLISSTISHNIINLKSYYSKRIKRLLPVILTVVTLVMIFSILIQTNTQTKTLSQIIVENVLFIGNLNTANNPYNPLGPFWYLAAQEQSILLILVFCFFISKIPVLSNPKKLLVKKIFLIFLIFATVIFSNVIYKSTDAISYFSTASRIGEIATGALLGLFINKLSLVARKFRNVSNYFFILAIILLIIISFTFQNETKSNYLLYPCLPIILTCIIIICYDNQIFIVCGKSYNIQSYCIRRKY